jgi:type III pantothenate kinase
MSSLILLIDIGNTRAKWSVIDGTINSQLDATHGALGHTESPFSLQGINHLEPVIRIKNSITEVILCSVAPSSIDHVWQQWLLKNFANAEISIFDSSLEFAAISNYYKSPHDLGNDRWAAIIGGSQIAPQGNYLVVNSGTATTIDFVNHELHFEGGWIIPGFNLMLQALGSKTALLPNLSAQVVYASDEKIFGNTTESAILQGVLHAQLGAIYFALNQFPQIKHLILSGGNAGLIHQNLKQSWTHNCLIIHDPYIVFRGLQLWRGQRV